jgi:chromatin remodeling complex protein RSC6
MATEKKASPKKAAAPKAEAAAAAEPVKKKAAATKAAEPVASVATAPAAESKRAPNAAFMKPLTPSAALAAVVGKKALPRTEAVKKIWEYIKKHDLQDAANKRNINADKKLKAVFGKDQVTMFEMTKLMSAHLK